MRSGRSRPSRSPGASAGTRSSTGRTRRSPSGSSAATLNITESCLDQHLAERGDKVAFHWEGEPGDTRTITYRELHQDVCRAANALAALGVKKGDRVAIYMGMVPELVVAMLACARLGAPHSIVFGGFSSDSLRDRILDAEAKVLITCDGAWRAGSVVPLKEMVDASVAETPSIEKVLVVRRTENDVNMVEGRDIWWHDLVPGQSSEHAAVEVDSEHMLYILYTSGTTAKPKGIVHTTGGYAVGTSFTHKYVFDLKPDDVYWCTADIGWVTGHSYIVYGPLINCATSVMFEGVPQYPDKDRFWDIVEKYKVTILYTAPTAIRTFVKWGDEYPGKHDLSSLRLLGTVGEPINPEAWMWYHRVIGGERCPIVDTWWQTETGMIMISPLPGVTATKPGSATFPLPGCRGRHRRRRRQQRPLRGRRLPDADPAVAGDAADPLQGPGAVQGGLLEPVLQARREQVGLLRR